MFWRKLLYASVATGVFAFYLYYGQWLAWIVFLATLALPWVSLLLSLPAILLTKITLVCPEQVQMNTGVTIKLSKACPLPLPPIMWNFQAYETFSSKQLAFSANAPFLADHCGSIHIVLHRSYIYDYLGLFAFPIGRKLQKTILVLPQPVPIKNLPSLKKYLAANWKPKPGGGFSEQYDLREYRPGDDLRQVHWKLAAKTGKIILREPMIPVRGNLALSLVLSGTATELDRKFGRLTYLADYFLKKDLPFKIHCNAGDGDHCFSIHTATDFSQALCTMLQLPLTQGETVSVSNASWHYRIGGGVDE